MSRALNVPSPSAFRVGRIDLGARVVPKRDLRPGGHPLEIVAPVDGVVLRRLHEELPKRPLVLAATSVATPAADPVQDEWRTQVLDAELREVARAVADGVDLRGVFFDTPVDAYEWGAGFDVQRGLFTADRKPKPSATLVADWALGRRSAG